MINRRQVLAGLAGAAIGGFGSTRRARANGSSLVPYPVLSIHLRGGLDPAMHLCATPNGPYGGGSVTIENRFNGTGAIKTTPSGIRYFTGAVAPAGLTDFEPHLPDDAEGRVIPLRQWPRRLRRCRATH